MRTVQRVCSNTNTHTTTASPNTAAAQRGVALIEALLAFLVVALGMLGIARIHADLRTHADLARQRTDAARIAGEEMERLRSFSVLAPSAGASSYDEITTTSATALDSDDMPTRYAIERSVTAIAGDQASAVTLTVRWNDRRGDAQHATLTSVIARSDPVFAAALTIASRSMPVRGALGRSAHVPLFAKDLGNGHSVFKPIETGPIAFVQDNLTGLVTARCTGLASTLTTATLTAADLTACDPTVGLLLSGTVRFAGTSPTDPSNANGPLLPFDIVLTLSGGSYTQAPACFTRPVEADGDRHSLYHCVVYPLANGRWSGRSTLAPLGWRIGTAADEYRVCRYSSDLDGSGAIDRNLEHPSDYADVDAALAQQNFLVVAGGDTCPTAAPQQVASEATGIYADPSKTQHQP